MKMVWLVKLSVKVVLLVKNDVQMFLLVILWSCL